MFLAIPAAPSPLYPTVAAPLRRDSENLSTLTQASTNGCGMPAGGGAPQMLLGVTPGTLQQRPLYSTPVRARRFDVCTTHALQQSIRRPRDHNRGNTLVCVEKMNG